MAGLIQMLLGRAGRRSTPAVAVRAPVRPAVPIAPAVPRKLRFEDFSAGAQVLNVLSQVLKFEVPRGELLELEGSRPFRLQLMAHLVGASVASSAGGEITIDFSAVDLVQTPRPAPTLPAIGHPDVVVYAVPSAGGTRAEATLKTVDYSGDSVVIQGLTPSTNYDYDAYGVFGLGQVSLRAIQPAGSDSRAVELFNDTVLALHETDQAAGLTAPRLLRGARGRFPLGPKWQLSIEVNSPASVATVAESRSIANFRARRAAVAVRDARGLDASVQRRLG